MSDVLDKKSKKKTDKKTTGDNTQPTIAPPTIDPSDAKKITFLQDLAGSAGDPIETEKKQQSRQKALDGVRDTLNDKSAEIRKGMDFELVEQNPGAFKTIGIALGRSATVKSFDPEGDPNKEFETGNAVMNDYQQLPPSVLKAIAEAHKMVTDLTAELRGKMDDGGTATHKEDGTPRAKGEKPTPMFSEADIDGVIAAEIWQPLVRSRTIPENAVPSKYSEVSTTFKGASDEYQKRLKKYSLTANDNDSKLKQSALGQSIFGGMNTMSGAVIGILKDQFPGGDAALIIKEVADCQALIQSLGTVAFGLTDQILKGEFDPDFLSSIVGLVGSAATVATDGSPGQKSSLAILTSGVTIALKSGQVMACVAKGDIEGAVKSFGGVLGGIVTSAGLGGTGTTDKDIGKGIETGISSLVDLTAATKAFHEGDIAKAGNLLTAAFEAIAKNAATTIITNQMKEEQKEKDKETVKEQGHGLDEHQKEVSGAETTIATEKTLQPFLNLIAIAASSPQTIMLLTATDDRIKKLIKAQVDARELKTAEKNWDLLDDKQKATILKMQSGAADAEYAASQTEQTEAKAKFDKLLKADDPKKIEKLTAALQLQKVKINLAIKLAQLPFAVIGAMFPPAQMGQCVIQLANEMRLLIDTGQQYLEWADNVQDAKKSGSVQAEAMTNRMDLSLQQSIRHGVEAAFNVIRIIGQGLTIAGGPVAHIGVALDKSAQAGQAAKQIIIAIKDYKDAAAAWKMYEKAFDNPENRTAIRASLRQNATLAKYAIAYGAKIANNRIAANALAKCGISDEMLNDEGSGVDKLVAYLEARFDEDPIILRAIPYGKWHPGDVELSGKSWLAFVQAAQDKDGDAKPRLEPLGNAATVAGALGGYEKAKKTYTDAGDKLTRDDVDDVLDQLMLARKTLIASKPLKKGNKPHAEFQSYITGMVALVDAQIEAMSTIAEKLKDDESAYVYFKDACAIQKKTLDDLTPAAGTDLAEGKKKVKTLCETVEQEEKDEKWTEALAAIRLVKIEITTLLADNTKSSDEVAKIAWDKSDLFEKARTFGDDLDTEPDQEVKKAKQDLMDETAELGKFQKELNWKDAKLALDKMTQLAEKVTITK